MTTRYRWFESAEGWCERCGWPDHLTDGLCRTCQEDPKLTTEPAWFVGACEVCGRESESNCCSRCNRTFVEEMETR